MRRGPIPLWVCQVTTAHAVAVLSDTIEQPERFQRIFNGACCKDCCCDVLSSFFLYIMQFFFRCGNGRVWGWMSRYSAMFCYTDLVEIQYLQWLLLSHLVYTGHGSTTEFRSVLRQLKGRCTIMVLDVQVGGKKQRPENTSGRSYLLSLTEMRSRLERRIAQNGSTSEHNSRKSRRRGVRLQPLSTGKLRKMN